jgi:hypothetical protein
MDRVCGKDNIIQMKKRRLKEDYDEMRRFG